MSPLPDASLLLAGALPAAALLSYLDAKFAFANDAGLVRGYIASLWRVSRKHKVDRLNGFYYVEEMATSSIKSNREHLFLIYQGQEWTYAQAYDLILRYATWLKERHDVKSGDIVAMDFTNKPTFLWMWYGLWALGATPAFVNFNLTGERLIHCVKAADASLVVFDDEIASVLDDPGTREAIENGGTRRIVILDPPTQTVISTWRAVRPDDSERAGVTPADMGLLVYTSGTTGMPKAAIVSWRKINACNAFVQLWMQLQHSDRFYTSMPLYHTSAAMLGVTCVVSAGATMVLGHKFSARGTMEEVHASKATIIQYVGETCRYLLASPPSPLDKDHNLRMAFGNGLRPDIWRQFKERFNIPSVGEFYASTESPTGSWYIQNGEFGVGAVQHTGLVADALVRRTTKIVKLDYDTDMPWRDPKTGFCVECPLGEPGELLWKVDADDIKQKFQGYYGNQKATEEKVLRSVFTKDDAWFRTGDLMKCDAEGLWYFVDRIGDTFRWKSENVSTAEVADVLGSYPAVEETVVYGVALPNHDGRCGCAAVIFKPETTVTDALLKDMATFIEARLPKYARPVFIRKVDEIERTGNNKQVKNELKADGVDPAKVPGNVWWLGKESGAYRPFGEKEWSMLVGGAVKL